MVRKQYGLIIIIISDYIISNQINALLSTCNAIICIYRFTEGALIKSKLPAFNSNVLENLINY